MQLCYFIFDFCSTPQEDVANSRLMLSDFGLTRSGNVSSSSLFEFACKPGSSATCDENDDCQASQFVLMGAFSLPEGDANDECGYVRMVQDGEIQDYEFDYACGCANGTAGYVTEGNNCGQYRVGVDVYTRNADWGDEEQATDYEGETLNYLRQSDIPYKSDLVEILNDFRNGTIPAGVYPRSYTFDIPQDADNMGCTISYKLDFVMGEQALDETE